MNKNHLTYDVVLSNDKILDGVEVDFDNHLEEQFKIKGGHFFYISAAPEDSNHLNFFDFCENVSVSVDYLKQIALVRFREVDMIFGNNDEDLKKESERLNYIKLFSEEKYEQSTVLIDKYFEIFKTDRINNKNWKDFINFFDLDKITPYVEEVIRDKKNTIVHDGNKNYLDFLNNKNSDKNVIGFNKIIEDSNFKAKKYYTCSNSKEIMTVVINNVFELYPNVVIKRCKNCGKLFIPSKADTICCTRKSPQYENKNCRQAFNIISKIDRLKKNPSRSLYKKIYDRLHKSIEYSKNHSEEKELNLILLKEKSKTFRKNIENGDKTVEQYYEWLKKIDETGVIPND